MSEGQGRARGRARGRSRPTTEVRRPAQPEVQPQQVVMPPQQQMSAPPPSGGRAHRRGVARGEPQGAAAVVPVHQMGAMSLEASGDNGRRTAGRGSVRGRPEAVEPTVVPSGGSTKQGDFGSPVELLANYFRVTNLPDMFIYQYHVDFNPQIESLGMRKGMLKEHEKLFSKYLFDGMALWTTTKLHNNITELYSTRRTDDAKIQIKIKFIHELSPRDPVIIQILNTQMRRNFSNLGFKLIGRNYFDITQTSELPQHRLEIIPGFLTSIRQHENNVLMLCDLSFKFVNKDTVLTVMQKLRRQDDVHFKARCEKELLGLTILTMYNNKTYRIDEIKWDVRPTNTFTRRDGSQVTFIDYMKDHWNLTVRDPRQPMLLSRPKARDVKCGRTEPYLFIPEFCLPTGISEEVRNNFKVMRDVAEHSRINPQDRVARLKSFLNRMKTNEAIREEMKKWGMEFSSNLQQVRGRMIGPELIYMTTSESETGRQSSKSAADWSEVVRGSRLLEPVRLENWMILFTSRDRSVMEEFLSTMRRICPPMGLVLAQPIYVECRDDRTNTFATNLRQNLSANVKMVVVISPNDRKDRYDAVKKICCVEFGIPSQVVVAHTLGRKQSLMSIVTKIAIQINCKLGGQVWRLHIPLTSLMVIGIDSYHDSAQKNMSVCGVVSSLNPFITKYHSQVSFQQRGQEMSDALTTQLAMAFRRYHEVHKSLPDRLVIYRDGVGDGQLPQVRNWELKQLNNAISAQGQNYKPKVVFVVVNKRINTRFFQRTGAERFDNPAAGTVVDTEVTRPERFDFYLVSQSVRQGTVSPTQYNVIYDTSMMKPNHLQRLTYKLCHLYYNWQGTVRVPAPCQYAHKLAFLVGQSLHTNPSANLADTLYYL